MIHLPSNIRRLIGTQGELAPHKCHTPIFISGCMRSGTTLLADKLSSHPQIIKIESELNEAWTVLGGANIIGKCEYKTYEDANSAYTYQMSNHIFKFIQKSKSPIRHLMRANQLFSTKRGRICYDWKNIVPLNKSTHLMNKISFVNKVFPNSKFIIIFRNIYAQSSSLKVHFQVDHEKTHNLHLMPADPNSCWSTVNKREQVNNIPDGPSFPPNFNLIPKMWIRLNALALKSLTALPDEQYTVLKYEDLVNNQEEELTSVFQFLNLDQKHIGHEKKIACSHIKHKNTTTPGNPLNKWKTNLSDSEINTIDHIIDTYREEYNFIMNTIDALNTKSTLSSH